MTTFGAPAASPAGTGRGLAALAAGGLVLAVGIAGLLLRESYLLAIAAAVAAPIAASLYRRPIVVVALWLLFAPLVMVVDGGGGGRRIYWLVHRLLPFAALGATLFVPWLAGTLRRLPRPGAPELLMVGYLAVSLASIAATSPEPLADAYVLYDRVAVPMLLFLVIRLASPADETIHRLFLVLAALVLSQAAFGIISWLWPETLPNHWLNRAGSRTTGSLRHPNVYGVSLLFGGAIAFHIGQVAPKGGLRRLVSVPLLVIGSSMAVLTLSRATWLAAGLVLVGIAFLHPRAFAKAALLGVPIVMLVVSSGILGITGQGVFDRLNSEQSALSRVPVVLGSIRMFEEKPVMGWGYNRFDDHDHQFQEGVVGLYVPTKDHASHNLFLTILAEQGIVGLGLYLGPAVVLAVRSIRSHAYLRARRRERQLVITVWLILGAHLVVTMFSNMRVAFGLGVWWICLSLIAVVTDRARSSRAAGEGEDPRAVLQETPT